LPAGPRVDPVVRARSDGLKLPALNRINLIHDQDSGEFGIKKSS
jgi:hypothetical protein